MANEIDPKKVSVRGRLSFPNLTMKDAIASARNSKYDQNKPVEELAPGFGLFLDQANYDKFVDHLLNTFLPYAAAQNKAGEDRDGKLSPREIKKIEAWLKAGDLEDAPPFMPLKPINPKYAEQTPEAVARLELKGRRNTDIHLKARVENESQMRVPDPELLTFPALKDLHETNFTMYPGAGVFTTVNLYAHMNSAANFGVGAGADTAVYLGNEDHPRLGGSTGGLNESDLFED